MLTSFFHYLNLLGLDYLSINNFVSQNADGINELKDGLHLQSPFLTVPLSEALLLKDALIVEALLLSELFEAVGYAIETITDDENEEVIFTEVFLA